MKERYERGEIAKKILMMFVVGGVVLTVATFPGLAYILEAFSPKNARQRQRVRQSVRGLEKKQLLVRKIQNGKEKIVLTDKGKRQVMGYFLEDLRIERPEKWDGNWRVLMYDIPEQKKSVRDEVNALVQNMGMQTIQNSVFVSPFPCKREIDMIAHCYELQEYFIYFETDNIECPDDLLKIFKLS